MRTILSLALLGSIAMSAVASDANSSTLAGNKPWWGLDAGVFMPTDSKLDGLFGKEFIRVGIQPVATNVGRNLRLRTDFGVISVENKVDRLTVIPLNVGLSHAFGKPDSKTVPFVNAGVGIYYADYKLRRLVGSTVTTFKDRKFGQSAFVSGGVVFNNRFMVQVRYDQFAKQDGFDFSGLSFGVQIGLFKF